jgi:ankyrin repeat protein
MRWVIAFPLLAMFSLLPAEPKDLHSAVLDADENVESVEKLIASGADCNACVQGRSLTGIAATAGKTKTLERLLAAGSDPTGSATVSPALIDAIQGGKKESIQLLLDYGADPREQTAKGLTPLLAAIERGDESIVMLLLNAGAISGQRAARDGAEKAARSKKLNAHRVL